MTNSTRLPRSGVLNIEYDADVLGRIEEEALDGFNLGGLLLGSYAGDSLRIAAFEAAPCDPQTIGERIRYLDTRARVSGQRVVGWYTAHKRNELAMSPEDLSLHDRFFPEAWQVALMLRPNPDGSMGAKFFLKEKAASLIPTSTPDGGGGRPELVPQRHASRVVEVRKEPAALKRRRGWGVWAALTAMAALSLGGVLYLRLHFPAPAIQTAASGLLRVEAVHRNGNIEVTWDPTALGDSTQGRLDVQDGGIRAQVVLDNTTLMAGKFTYAYKSDVTGFRMRVEKANGSVLEGSTTYVAPNSVAVAPPPVEVVPLTAEPDPERAVKAPVKETFELPQRETRREAWARRKMEREERRAQQKELAKLREKEAVKVGPAPPQAIIAEKAPQAVAQVKTQSPAAANPQVIPQPITPPISQPSIQPTPQFPIPSASQPVVPIPPPSVKPRLQLAGRWTLHRGSASRSPAVPESLLINVLEGNGSLQGTLDARYRAGQKREKMSFSFTGQAGSSQAGTGSARFPWKSGDGSTGFIEFIRVPNSASQFEVVWYGLDSKQVFDEIVRKDK